MSHRKYCEISLYIFIKLHTHTITEPNCLFQSLCYLPPHVSDTHAHTHTPIFSDSISFSHSPHVLMPSCHRSCSQTKHYKHNTFCFMDYYDEIAADWKVPSWNTGWGGRDFPQPTRSDTPWYLTRLLHIGYVFDTNGPGVTLTIQAPVAPRFKKV